MTEVATDIVMARRNFVVVVVVVTEVVFHILESAVATQAVEHWREDTLVSSNLKVVEFVVM